MLAETACAIINEAVVFFPGWNFTAEDYCHRFEDTVRCTVHYPAVQTNRADAHEGYLCVIEAVASFVIVTGDCRDEVDLLRCLLDGAIMKVHEHESREGLRLRPSYWAPFHPHKVGGMRRWGDPGGDLSFGLA